MSLPLFPKPLVPGGTLGICAPASPPQDPARVDEVLENLRRLGYSVKAGRHLHARNGYLAGSESDRISDLHSLFADPDVDAVWALRGGYGSCRLLPGVDFKLIRQNPKPFLGYSDITSLHNAVWSQSGLVTFHAPNAGDAFEPENAAALARVVQAPLSGGGIPLFDRAHGAHLVGGITARDRETKPILRTVETVGEGTATGRLIGGNLTCLLTLLGTPFFPDVRGALLFVEDIHEKAYRLDRNWTQLRLAGVLSQLAGVIVGECSHPDAEEQERIGEFWQRELPLLRIPSVRHAPIGHFLGQITIPIGAQAELQASAGKLNLLPQGG